MEKYRNKSGQSGVVAYEIGDDFIKIKFKNNNHVYVYNNQIPGTYHVKAMKERAVNGIGLATYVSKYVKEKYYSLE